MSKRGLAELASIADIIMGQSPESSSYNDRGEGIPFFQGNADFSELHPNTRLYCSRPTKIAHPDDILISVRAPIGAINIANQVCCIGRGLAAIRVKENAFNKYLYYCLRRKNKELNQKGTGSTFKAINKQDLSGLIIPLPALDIQKKIAHDLDTVSKLLNLRKRQLEELDQLIKSVFYEMFGDPVTNEKEWEIKVLSSCTSKIGSGATPKGGEENYKKTGISFIRSLNVYDGYFNFQNLAYIDNKQAEALKNVVVEEGDVLINITGASIARSCVVPSEILPARVNQHVSIVRPIKDQLVSIYLNHLFIVDTFKQKLLSIGKGNGATREAITKQQLENLKIPVPPLNLQKKYAKIVTQIEFEKSLIKQSIVETQLLFDSLMSKYFDD